MSLATLLSQLVDSGHSLGADASGLILRGTGARLSPEAVDALREHRALLSLLVPRPTTEAPLPAIVSYVTHPAGLAAAAEHIAKQKAVGFDVETTGLNPICDRLRLVQVAIPEGPVYVFDHQVLGDLGLVVEALRGVELVGHNIGFDLSFVSHHLGLTPRALWCTMTASKLLDGGLNLHTEGFHTLQGLTARSLGIAMSKEDQKSDWSGALTTQQIEYAARDAAVVLVLRDLLAEELLTHGLRDVAELEFKLVPVLVDMWSAGVGFDGSRWEPLIAQRTAEAQELRAYLQRELTPDPSCDFEDEVNPSSQRQVLAALQRRGLKILKTNKEALAPHATDLVVMALLRYRSLMSFLRGPGVGLPAAAGCYADGRIRARLNPLAAPTGRFGCREPNLQGLEKSKKKQSKETDVPEARSCITPALGFVFIDADYCAIELRVLAQITKDPRLLKIFREDGDPHKTMAALVARKLERDVTPEERGRAKAVNFGFPFGMGVDRFIEYALALYGVAFRKPEAEAFKAAWERAFPGVVHWQKRIGRAKPMEVRTRSGRRRCFESRQEGYCERLNMPVQGSAADGMKLAMVLLHGRLRPYGARIVMTVHDELLVECPRDLALAVKASVVQTMVEGMQHYVPDVPIVVEADIRTSWSAKDKIVLVESMPLAAAP